ncbi:hypothetical protein KAJ83_02555 [Marivibrio halodurans]|uniref:Uncharacterized protein n=1 Tax=Marivibrio halodurans TaxID=2039722 RepID=A0A8J7SJY4_9PROT|nr:hypothetical protein [Marivibrio halodurans]MBP5855873.1 hypothetical protein [Marivibrio halodurans]
MTDPIIQRQNLFSLLDMAKRPGQSTGMRMRGNESGSESILAMLEKSDPEGANALRTQIGEARSVLDRMEAVRENAGDQRKEAARQKIERIKAQLAMLRLLAAADPEAAARQASRLARELAAAVKDYTASGGTATVTPTAGAGVTGGAMAGQTPPPTAGATTSGASEAETTTTAEATPPQSTSIQATATPTPDQSPANEGAPGKPDEDADGKARGQTGDGSDTAPSPSPREEEREAIRNRANALVGQMAQRFGESRAESEFAAEIRQIKAALKTIMEAAKRKLRAEDGESDADRDIKAGERALREVERALDSLAPAPAAGPSVTVDLLA